MRPLLGGGFKTSQEQNLVGGSPFGNGTPKGTYTPEAYLEGSKTLEDTRAAREEAEIFLSSIAALNIGVEGQLVYKLQPLDENGQTISDPEVIGRWDRDKKEIIDQDKGKEWTLEVYKTWKRLDAYYDELLLREPWKSLVEGSPQSPETER